MSQRNTFGVTVDIVKFVRMLLSSPLTAQMMLKGILQGPLEPNDMLGACNLSSDPETKAWYSVFMRTRRDHSPGQDGYIVLNREGSRVSLRLQRQEPRRNLAQIDQTSEVPQADNQLLADALQGNPEAAQALLNMANKGQSMGDKLQEEHQAESPFKEDNSEPSLEEDFIL